MDERAIMAVVALALLASGADARFPAPGDEIYILTGTEAYGYSYFGNITAVHDGLICLNCSKAGKLINDKGSGSYTDIGNICIGTGSITMLKWVDSKAN